MKHQCDTVTGWILTDAIIVQDCPKCKSPMGYYCQTPKGKKAKTHTERITKYLSILKNPV